MKYLNLVTILILVSTAQCAENLRIALYGEDQPIQVFRAIFAVYLEKKSPELAKLKKEYEDLRIVSEVFNERTVNEMLIKEKEISLDKFLEIKKMEIQARQRGNELYDQINKYTDNIIRSELKEYIKDKYAVVILSTRSDIIGSVEVVDITQAFQEHLFKKYNIDIKKFPNF